MIKIGSIAWHKQELERLQNLTAASRARAKKEEKQKVKEGYGNTIEAKTKLPTPRLNSRIEYDFLKYIRVVFKWALENNPELTRPKLEFILYLYGLGAFSKKQFDDYHKLVGLYSIRTFQEMIDGGWIKIWRLKGKKQHALYVLTQKTKIMCNKMHKYCCGVEQIPMTKALNKMVEKDTPRVNQYYLEIIKRMNKDKAPQV